MKSIETKPNSVKTSMSDVLDVRVKSVTMKILSQSERVVKIQEIIQKTDFLIENVRNHIDVTEVHAINEGLKEDPYKIIGIPEEFAKVIEFAANCLSMDSNPEILSCSLQIMRSFLDDLDYFHPIWYLTEIPSKIQQYAMYPDPDLQTMITSLYLDLSADPDITPEFCYILCENFHEIAIQWTLVHSNIDCRRNCIWFFGNLFMSKYIYSEEAVLRVINVTYDIMGQRDMSVYEQCCYCLVQVLKNISFDSTEIFQNLYVLFWNIASTKTVDPETGAEVYSFSFGKDSSELAELLLSCFELTDNIVSIVCYQSIFHTILTTHDNYIASCCGSLLTKLVSTDVENCSDLITTMLVDGLMNVLSVLYEKSYMCQLLSVGVFKNLIFLGTMESKIVAMTDQFMNKLLDFIENVEHEISVTLMTVIKLAFEQFQSHALFGKIIEEYSTEGWIEQIQNIVENENEELSQNALEILHLMGVEE